MASVPELLLANYISAQSRALTLMNLWLLEEEETEEESEEEEDEDDGPSPTLQLLLVCMAEVRNAAALLMVGINRGVDDEERIRAEGALKALGLLLFRNKFV